VTSRPANAVTKVFTACPAASTATIVRPLSRSITDSAGTGPTVVVGVDVELAGVLVVEAETSDDVDVDEVDAGEVLCDDELHAPSTTTRPTEAAAARPALCRRRERDDDTTEAFERIMRLRSIRTSSRRQGHQPLPE
jgi:hypothetical protein